MIENVWFLMPQQRLAALGLGKFWPTFTADLCKEANHLAAGFGLLPGFG